MCLKENVALFSLGFSDMFQQQRLASAVMSKVKG